MTPRTTSDMVPAPAITAGIVNTPVPTMLPMTSPVAEVSPSEWAFSSLRGDIGVVASGLGVDGLRAMVIRLTCFLRPLDGRAIASRTYSDEHTGRN